MFKDFQVACKVLGFRASAFKVLGFRASAFEDLGFIK